MKNNKMKLSSVVMAISAIAAVNTSQAIELGGSAGTGITIGSGNESNGMPLTVETSLAGTYEIKNIPLRAKLTFALPVVHELGGKERNFTSAPDDNKISAVGLASLGMGGTLSLQTGATVFRKGNMSAKVLLGPSASFFQYSATLPKSSPTASTTESNIIESGKTSNLILVGGGAEVLAGYDITNRIGVTAGIGYNLGYRVAELGAHEIKSASRSKDFSSLTASDWEEITGDASISTTGNESNMFHNVSFSIGASYRM